MASVMRVIKENESEESKKIPKVYKMYIADMGEGYRPAGKYVISKVIKLIDSMIESDWCPSRILVIEESRLGQTPVLLYQGNEEEYLEFKELFSDTSKKGIKEKIKMKLIKKHDR